MSPEETLVRIERVATDIEKGALGEALGRAASNALQMLSDRIQNTGIDADGKSYPPYSTNPMYAWCGNMTQSACSSARGKYKRKKPKNSTEPLHSFLLVGGYKEYRDLAGRQTGFVDFNFNGDMWANIKVVSSDEEHRKGMARISADNTDQYLKLKGNTERKGVILDLNQKEIDKVNAIINEEIIDLFRRNDLL